MREPFDFPYEEASFTFKGVKYIFRELTVAQMDECREMATNDTDQTIDGRAMMRFEIVASSYEPKLTLDLLSKCPQRLYLNFVDLVNTLNDPDALKDEAEAGNS
jgi:hypothetical protein